MDPARVQRLWTSNIGDAEFANRAHSRSQNTAANSGMLAYVPRIEQQGSNPSIHGFLSEPPAPVAAQTAVMRRPLSWPKRLTEAEGRPPTHSSLASPAGLAAGVAAFLSSVRSSRPP